jgi:aquaporin related protein
MIGAISWVRAGLVFIAEMLGAMASAGVVAALFPGTEAVQTTLGGGTSLTQGLCKYEVTTSMSTMLTLYSHRNVLDC